MFAGSYREFLPFCNRFFSINWHLPDTFQVDTTLFGSDKQIFSQKKLIANKAKIAFRVKEEPPTYFLKAFLFDFACFAFAVDIFPVWPGGGFRTACILAIRAVESQLGPWNHLSGRALRGLGAQPPREFCTTTPFSFPEN